MNAQVKPKWAKTITEVDQIECLALADMLIDRANACSTEQSALRAFLMTVAEKLKELAK